MAGIAVVYDTDYKEVEIKIIKRHSHNI